MKKNDQFQIEWIDREREPQCPPDQRYPHGKDIDASFGLPNCLAELPYPAKRCGIYRVECLRCGISIGITTAGRPDDPKSVRIPCGPKKRDH